MCLWNSAAVREVLNVLTIEALEHRTVPPYAYPVGPKTLRVRLRAKRGEVRRCRVFYDDRYVHEGSEKTTDMVRVATDQLFDYFQGDLHLALPRFRYAFCVEDGTRRVWFTEAGSSFTPPCTGFFQYPYIHRADVPDVPDWLVDGIVYQIFPERFANGDSKNDPKNAKPWTDQKPTGACFYGGDLQGVIDRLPYLQELGVTVLYLNPIFKSPSNHKYDTTDYYTIDPHFGDAATFRRLVDEAHRAGIYVILDAVFNHCGFDFHAFADVRQRGKESPYKDWFYIEGFPVRTDPPNYETFANSIASMPKLRTENPEVREYLLDVARYWTAEFDIDGWRIDVANEVDHDFWRHFRSEVKKLKPDAYIVGEIWHEAAPWLMGDQFDGVTNYPLREACLDFFARGAIDAVGFAEAVAKNQMLYPEGVLQASWNLLGSHDTERFLTACAGDVKRYALALAFIMTWIGAPMIYYGDEVGMEGNTDPDCRRTMQWDKDRWNMELFELHKRLIAVRRDHPGLRRGAARIVAADPVQNTLVWWRGEGRDGLLIALNNSGRQQDVVVDMAGAIGSWAVLVGMGHGEREKGNSVRIRLSPYSAVMGRIGQ